MNPQNASPNYRCVTPPPLPKQQLAALVTPHSYSFQSSPVTPHAPHRPQRNLQLQEHENLVLSAMLERMHSHRAADQTLCAHISAVGNAAYINNRSVIIEWMGEVCTSFMFHPATLHLAVRHMDSVFSRTFLPKHSWQLCAVTAIFLSAKCEETASCVPVIDDLIFVCDNSVDEKVIARMEFFILQCLQWDLVAKTPVHFINHFISIAQRCALQRFVPEPAPVASSPAPPPHPSHRLPNVGPLEGFLLDHNQQDQSLASHGKECSCVGECSCIQDTLSVCSDDTEDFCSSTSSHVLQQRPNYHQQPTSTASSDCSSETHEDESVGSLLHRTAICILDLSLYDSSLREKFPPNVIAAAALSIASEVSDDTWLRPAEVSAITAVSEIDMLDCRLVLWTMFLDAQV